MAIPTSRTREAGSIAIDREKCNGCGLCVDVCKDFGLELLDGKAVVGKNSAFGCMACGHCMMICPRGAITVTGRFSSPEDLIPVPKGESAATFEQFTNLLKRRRSVREFKDKAVPKEVLDRIIEAASLAPMGIPPSDVNVLVLDSREKLDTFANDFCKYLENIKWMFSPTGLSLMRLFNNKETIDLYRNFVSTLIEKYTGSMKEGINNITYEAPAALYFYGTSYSDPADPYIAATYAMLAADAMGLGSCMIGGVHPFIQSGKYAAQLREKWGIKYKSRNGLIVILGYPRLKYHSSIRRTFASVDWN